MYSILSWSGIRQYKKTKSCRELLAFLFLLLKRRFYIQRLKIYPARPVPFRDEYLLLE
jgi:hypothetical protein